MTFILLHFKCIFITYFSEAKFKNILSRFVFISYAKENLKQKKDAAKSEVELYEHFEYVCNSEIN